MAMGLNEFELLNSALSGNRRDLSKILTAIEGGASFEMDPQEPGPSESLDLQGLVSPH